MEKTGCTTCTICGEGFDDDRKTVTIGEKGASGVNKASDERGDSIHVQTGTILHVKCRLGYCNKKAIQSSLKRKREEPPETRTLRSNVPSFRFADHCFLCGNPIGTPTKKKNDDKFFQVRTENLQASIRQACGERGSNDDWANAVRGRVASAVGDLHAADAIYHQVCSVNFRTGKQIPMRFRGEGSGPAKVGRQSDITREDAFQKVIDDLRANDDEQTTISDLVHRMSEICPSPYSATYMRQKIVEHLGDNIVITNINGKENVVTFYNTAAKILDTFYSAPKTNDAEAEKHRIITTAAELIKSDIKNCETSKAFYPDASDLESTELNLSYLPESLQLLLSRLFIGQSTELKVASIGQCIMQLTRPRVLLAPIPFGIGVQMHHLYGSEFLIDSLNKLGFCVSYKEVLHFADCATKARDDNFSISGHFGHYIADNVDHNLRTLDGHGTFHGMGIIVAVTPEIKRQRLIPRLQRSAKPNQWLPEAKIAIRYYNDLKKRTPMMYQKLPVLKAEDSTSNLDLLWKISWPLRPTRPGWSGLMQTICKSGQHPGKSSIHFLPMIDLNPTDMSCIYSTLLFVLSENKKHGTTPILTFDQPLWFKAKTIINNEPVNSDLKSVILKLGSFHIMMSYLGCIGHLMTSSGLKELLESVFADNAVTHMLSGKAYARAVRGHTLVNAALNALVLSEAYDVPLPDYDLQGDIAVLHPDLNEAIQLFDSLLVGEVTVESVQINSVFQKIKQVIEEQKDMITARSPTGQLWVQYMTMVDLLLNFLKSERTGDFRLHLKTLQRMLPYLASSGHSHYTKSVHIYIQDMLNLEESSPNVYEKFLSGYFVIRRSNRFWAGLSTDLIIEQVLMRAMKATGGLTRGRGMDEVQRTRWLLSMPASAEINESIQELTGTQYTTSEQHKEMSESRKTRDCKDTKILLEFLRDRNPFQQVDTLQNIATGVVASASVNPHRAVQVGTSIQEKMVGQNAMEFSFKKADHVKVMGEKLRCPGDETVVIDPQLLFQRLLIIAKNATDCNIDDLFKYELSNLPTSLFDDKGFLREANKPQLADTLATLVSGDGTRMESKESENQVLDGGSLLQRLPWKKDDTYDQISDMYIKYVSENYSNAVVVFDSYDGGHSTKDMTHLRRTKGGMGPRVAFAPTMPLKLRKEHFLANPENKQRFINLLKEKMNAKGIKTLSADGDADILIAETGVKCARSGLTHVIGEDTDILVLLCYHFTEDCQGLFFRSDRKNAKSKVWDISKVRHELGKELCHMLPVIHSMGGCDTTSRIYGVGKGSLLKKVRNSASLTADIQILSKSGLTPQEVGKAGERVLVSIFGGKQTETLDRLRARKFSEKVATSTSSVQVHTLPPTSDAGKYHSWRVYYQAQVWMGTGQDLNPTDWGWQLLTGEQHMKPCKMDMLPAPDFLLKMIRCQCKGDCDSLRCTCRKNRMECSSACAACKGTACSNSSNTGADDTYSSFDEYDTGE